MGGPSTFGPANPYQVTADGFVRVTDRGLGLVLPRDVVAVEAHGAVEPTPLFPEEESYIAGAIERRRLEFARGRSCARMAFAALGMDPVAIISASDRSPIWPRGVVGSITHCRNYACAAVAHAQSYVAVGIDAEVLQELEDGVEKLVVLPAEAKTLAALPGGVPWSCVAFSAKEAFYKAQYPRTQTFLDFHDVEVALDIGASKFTVTVLRDDPALAAVPRSVTGRFAIADERVLCAVVLRA